MNEPKSPRVTAPYFPFFVNDYLGDENISLMDLADQGAHVRLMCFAWKQDQPGTLRDDDSYLCRLVGIPAKQWQKSKQRVLRGWKHDGLHWVHEGLRKAYMKQREYSESRKQAAEARWGKKEEGNAYALHTDEQPDAYALHTVCSSSASSELRVKTSMSGCAGRTPAIESVQEGIAHPNKNISTADIQIDNDGGRSGAPEKTIPLPPSAPAPSGNVTTADLFPAFYEAYPRKGKRKEALAIFLRLQVGGSLLGTMLDAVKRAMRTDWQGKDTKHVPYADAWLSGKRWRDE